MKLSFVLMCTLTRKDAREKNAGREGGRNAKVARSAVFEGPSEKTKRNETRNTQTTQRARDKKAQATLLDDRHGGCTSPPPQETQRREGACAVGKRKEE